MTPHRFPSASPQRSSGELHTSSITLLDSCKRKFVIADKHWGLGYSPKYPQPAFWMGSVAHETLEEYYYHGKELMQAFADVSNRTLNSLDERVGGLWDEEKKEWTDRLALLCGMFQGYEAWQAGGTSEWDDRNLEYLQIEQDFHIVHDGHRIGGRWDGLVRRRDTGQLWLFETKTCRSIEELIRGLDFDPQPKLYLGAAQMILGEEISGVLYNILQKADPYNIPLLKSGLPSKAVRSTVQTTYEVYSAFLEECLEDLRYSEERKEHVRMDYEEQLSYLFQQGPVLYRRYPVRISQTEIQASLEYIVMAAEEVERLSIDPSEVRPSRSRFSCPRCPYREPCLAMDYGGPWKEVLDRQFITDGGGEDDREDPYSNE